MSTATELKTNPGKSFPSQSDYEAAKQLIRDLQQEQEAVNEAPQELVLAGFWLAAYAQFYRLEKQIGPPTDELNTSAYQFIVSALRMIGYNLLCQVPVRDDQRLYGRISANLRDLSIADFGVTFPSSQTEDNALIKALGEQG